MNKQEFMATSLPHGLKAMIRTENKYIHNVDHYMYQYICDSDKDESLYKYDLILRPPSDITKPITHNGETFVPNEKLDEYFGECIWFEKGEIILPILLNPFRIVMQLIEWHFDIAGLIEKGEAIDVNTLETNPYK